MLVILVTTINAVYHGNIFFLNILQTKTAKTVKINLQATMKILYFIFFRSYYQCIYIFSDTYYKRNPPKYHIKAIIAGPRLKGFQFSIVLNHQSIFGAFNRCVDCDEENDEYYNVKYAQNRQSAIFCIVLRSWRYKIHRTK